MASLLYDTPRRDQYRDNYGAVNQSRDRKGAVQRRGGKKRSGPIKLKTHNVERSVLEAVFARGDRRLADSVEHAFQAGARFDGWDECFKADLWQRAFDATGVDPAFYAHRERPRSEVFPWSHLHGGASQDYLERQYDDMFTQIGVSRREPAAVVVQDARS